MTNNIDEWLTTEEETAQNVGVLSGIIAKDATKSHEVENEWFYELKLATKRLSGQEDVIPVTISERLLENADALTEGNPLTVKGEFRSYNRAEEGKNKLYLQFFVKKILSTEQVMNDYANKLMLVGYVCKPPVYRETPGRDGNKGREIADLLLAVNRPHSRKSDYIPTITWGRNARFCGNLAVGTRVKIFGRIQSREYQKKLGEILETRTAYEVSVSSLNAEQQDAQKRDEAAVEENNLIYV